jgi:hypothetical protein
LARRIGKESRELKLNERLSLSRSTDGAAENQLIDIEDVSERELRRLTAAYLWLSSGNSRDDDTRQKTADLRACPPPKQSLSQATLQSMRSHQ